MMTKWTLRCGALCMLAIGQVHAATLTPVDVTNLYLKVVVNHDAAAVAKLNAYLKPVRDSDFASIDDLKKADAEYPQSITNTIMENAVPIRYREQLAPSILNLIRSQYAAQLGTRCEALSAKPAEAAKGQEAVKVDVECQIPRVSEQWSDMFKRLRQKKSGADEYARAIQGLQGEYDDHKTTPARIEFPLAREKRAGALWRNDFPTETTNKLFYPEED